MTKPTYDKLYDELFMHSHLIEDITDLTNPFQFKGEINVNSDFPTAAEVQNGWMYTIGTDVTDNDGSKTNTGQSFEAGDEIAWNGVDWTELGSTELWQRAGTVLSPKNTGDDAETTGHFKGGTSYIGLIGDDGNSKAGDFTDGSHNAEFCDGNYAGHFWDSSLDVKFCYSSDPYAMYVTDGTYTAELCDTTAAAQFTDGGSKTAILTDGSFAAQFYDGSYTAEFANGSYPGYLYDGSSNYVYLGGGSSSYSVEAYLSSGTAAVYGSYQGGNYGILGSSSYGVEGYCSSGTSGGYFSYQGSNYVYVGDGSYGINAYGSSSAGYFSNGSSYGAELAGSYPGYFWDNNSNYVYAGGGSDSYALTAYSSSLSGAAQFYQSSTSSSVYICDNSYGVYANKGSGSYAGYFTDSTYYVELSGSYPIYATDGSSNYAEIGGGSSSYTGYFYNSNKSGAVYADDGTRSVNLATGSYAGLFYDGSNYAYICDGSYAFTTSNPVAFTGNIGTGLSSSSGVYTDESSILTNSIPTSGDLGYWYRNGTTIRPATITWDISFEGWITTTSFVNCSDIITTLGATGTPSHTFVGDSNTGMWSSGADILNFSAGGTEILELDTTEATFSTRIACGGSSSGQSIIAKGLVVNAGGTGADATSDFRVGTLNQGSAFVVDASLDKVTMAVPLQLPYLGAAPAGLTNGMIWMESDGLHVYYGGTEYTVAVV